MLVLDLATDAVEFIETHWSGGQRWDGICELGGNFYCATFRATAMLVIDPAKPTDEAVSFIETDAAGDRSGPKTLSTQKWAGICSLGRKLYCGPYHSSAVLVVDPNKPAAQAVSYIETGREGRRHAGICEYAGKLYCAPSNSSFCSRSSPVKLVRLLEVAARPS